MVNSSVDLTEWRASEGLRSRRFDLGGDWAGHPRSLLPAWRLMIATKSWQSAANLQTTAPMAHHADARSRLTPAYVGG